MPPTNSSIHPAASAFQPPSHAPAPGARVATRFRLARAAGLARQVGQQQQGIEGQVQASALNSLALGRCRGRGCCDCALCRTLSRLGFAVHGGCCPPSALFGSWAAHSCRGLAGGLRVAGACWCAPAARRARCASAPAGRQRVLAPPSWVAGRRRSAGRGRNGRGVGCWGRGWRWWGMAARAAGGGGPKRMNRSLGC